MLFQNFERLLLLQRGGETVYHGPIGEDAKDLIGYLERNGAKVPVSPCVNMLDNRSHHVERRQSRRVHVGRYWSRFSKACWR
jgi:hypothetical protein